MRLSALILRDRELLLKMHWKLKVATQFLLAKIPGGETVNHRLQWLNGNYSNEALRNRIHERLPLYRQIEEHVSLRGARVVEVGTGWELLDPLIMFAFGTAEIHTYDHLPHLRFRVPRIIVSELAKTSPPGCDPERLAALQRAANLEELLATAHIHYVAPGDARRTRLPDKSVDLFFSYATLEHIRPPALAGIIAESKRVLKSSGISFHVIDPGDHYASYGVSKVNFLRYSDRAWDFWIQNKISYHNRLRAKDFLAMFEQQGAHLLEIDSHTDQADVDMLRNGFPLNHRFATFSPEELAVHYLAVAHSY